MGIDGGLFFQFLWCNLPHGRLARLRSQVADTIIWLTIRTFLVYYPQHILCDTQYMATNMDNGGGVYATPDEAPRREENTPLGTITQHSPEFAPTPGVVPVPQIFQVFLFPNFHFIFFQNFDLSPATVFYTSIILLYTFFMEELTLTDDESKIEVDVMATSLNTELNKKYNEEFVKLLKRVAYEIAIIGLPVNEACMYVGMDFEKLTMLMQTDPLIQRLIQTKDLEYKRGLMKAVSEKAKTDDKMSQWLLERRYPDEFNSRKGTKGGGGENDADLLGIAVEFIQKSGDNAPLVNEKSGKITILKKGHSTINNADVFKKIDSLLT